MKNRLDLPDLPARLRHARTLAGISARELSVLMGCAPGYVALLESGVRPSPVVASLGPAGPILGVSLDWLVFGTGESPTEESVRAAVERARAESPRTGTEG